jgi:signal transduction histidine kinase
MTKESTARALEGSMQWGYFDQVDTAVLVVHASSGKIIYGNPGSRSFLELAEGVSLEGQELVAYLVKGEGDRNFKLDFLTGDHTTKLRSMLFLSARGRAVEADVTVAPLQDDADFVLLTVNDLYDVRRLTKHLGDQQAEMQNILNEVQRQNEELKGLDIAKNHFISLVSHELRTPLSGMMGYVDLLLKQMYSSEKEMREYLQVIFSEGSRLTEMVNDFLDISRIMAGRMQLFVGEHNVVAQVDRALERMNSFAKQNSVKTLRVSKEENLVAFIDADRALQVFLNIIHNAIKFSPNGAQVEVRVYQKSSHWVEVSVQDHGIGIEPENFEKVFKDFEMVEAVETHHKGTGLGMPLCQRLMKLLGGTIWFESEFGKGTTFFVKFPTQKILDPSCYGDRNEHNDSIVF